MTESRKSLHTDRLGRELGAPSDVVCDGCEELILESEPRHKAENGLVCCAECRRRDFVPKAGAWTAVPSTWTRRSTTTGDVVASSWGIKDQAGESVAAISGNIRRSPEEKTVHVNLMTAAPDLFNACRVTLLDLEALETRGHGSALTRHIMDNLRAAMKKAYPTD